MAESAAEAQHLSSAQPGAIKLGSAPLDSDPHSSWDANEARCLKTGDEELNSLAGRQRANLVYSLIHPPPPPIVRMFLVLKMFQTVLNISIHAYESHYARD